MISIREGNLLLQDDIEIIAHVTNCKGVMGAGIAKALADKYGDDLLKPYEKLCNAYGHHMSHILLGSNQYLKMKDGKTIANMFAQDGYGTTSRYLNYNSFRECIEKLRKEADGRTVGIPYKVGCGLAGGDWGIVSRMLERAFKGKKDNLIICRFEPNLTENGFIKHNIY